MNFCAYPLLSLPNFIIRKSEIRTHFEREVKVYLAHLQWHKLDANPKLQCP